LLSSRKISIAHILLQEVMLTTAAPTAALIATGQEAAEVTTGGGKRSVFLLPTIG